MEPVTGRIINKFFKNDILESVATEILGNGEFFTEKVQSLKFLALKATMKKRIGDDAYRIVFFSLFFREPLCITNFFDPKLPGNFFKKWKTIIMNKLNGSDKKRSDYLEIRRDPTIMFPVFEHNFDDKFEITIVISRKKLIIKYFWFRIAIFENRENQEFDTFLAEKVFRLCARKRCYFISLMMDGAGKFSLEYMENYLGVLIDSLKPPLPKDGWEPEFARENRTVYRRIGDNIIGVNNGFKANFHICKTFSESGSHSYWGSFV